MEELEIYCYKCRKKTIHQKERTEEKDKGTYKLIFIYGKCSLCGTTNQRFSRKKID